MDELLKMLEELKAEIAKLKADNSAVTASEFAKRDATIASLTSSVAKYEKELNEQVVKFNTLGAASKNDSKESLGVKFVNQDKVQKAMATNETVKFAITAPVIGGVSVIPVTQSNANPLVPKPLELRTIMNVQPTTNGAVESFREIGYSGTASIGVEGVAAGAVDITIEPVVAALEFVQDTFPVGVRTYRDASQVASLIDNRLMYALIKKENATIIKAIVDDAAIQDYNGATDGTVALTKLDNLRRAITLAKIAEYPVEAILVNPTDFGDIELTKGGDGSYTFLSFGDVSKAWRVPIYESTDIDAGDFLLGAFNSAATLFDNGVRTIEASNQVGTNFLTNMLTLKAQEEIKVVINRPEAFVLGVFGSPV